MKIDFPTWLNNELQERSWSQSELARRAGMSSAQVSDVIGSRTDPGLKFYQGISHALKIPLVTVFEKAGILSNPQDNPYLTELTHLLHKLSPHSSQDIVAYAHFRASQDQKQNKKAPTRGAGKINVIEESLIVERFLWDVSETELRDAVIEMVKKLGIPGSVSREYDLYEAVSKEHKKALANKEYKQGLERELENSL